MATCLLLLLAASLSAFERASYYRSADGKSAATLKTALYKIVGNPNVKSYGSLWTYYYQTDRLSDNQVVDRYSYTKRYFTSNNGSAVSGMNKEHGIPQSWWGGGTTGIGSDLQHVMPSESDANSLKSNYGMGVVTSQTWTNGSIKVGKGTAGNNGTVQLWEPADEWKGDFARIYFYIVTAYEEKSLVQQQGANSMQNNTYPKLQPWAYELYMKWSKEDPVDERERQRNEVVYGIQGNRNPFIDYPGLEQYIWGSYKDIAFNASGYEDPYGNPSQKDPTATFALPTVSLTEGSTYTQTVTTNSDGTVTYESSDDRVATVNATTGLVTAKTAGSATITAIIGATASFRPTTASYSVVVTKGGDDPKPIGGNSYVKLTSAPADWSGVYLIVYEKESLALNGSLETFDKTYNTIEVDIEDDEIVVTDATEAAEFIVAVAGSGYSFQGKSGKYMGSASSSNGLATGDTPYINTLSVSGTGEAVVASEHDNVLRFNSANGQKRFRYYKSGQEPVTLYRRTETDTGISDMLSKQTTPSRIVYDLAGRRVSEVRHSGLYIVNGKKVLMKK